ncbi:hypothetical protein BGZ60DRAFT_157628 [Tricladium varicosporioides]|nr:hypothetical protein BGZ60DRAFT_157628 [Hymenoscyphus varicosporioides]
MCVQESTLTATKLYKHLYELSVFFQIGNGQKSVIGRLLNYARVSKPLLESQEARCVFNDLQSILSSEHRTYNRDPFDVFTYAESRADIVEHDITRIRNLMNLAPGLVVDQNWNGASKSIHALLHQDLARTLLASSYRCSDWETPYESVRTAFWDFSGDSVQVSGERNDINTSDKDFAASITIARRDRSTSSFRVIFDITPHLDPVAKITYQAIRPNDSEIFRIVMSGEVEKLVEALAKGTASLTDRDEEGRSLLKAGIHNLIYASFLLTKVLM